MSVECCAKAEVAAGLTSRDRRYVHMISWIVSATSTSGSETAHMCGSRKVSEQIRQLTASCSVS